MAIPAAQDPAELAASLQEYQEQLGQVQELLAVEPHNSEYLDLQQSLLEVIGLTSDLLRSSAPASGITSDLLRSGGPSASGFSSGPSLPTTGNLLKTKWSPGEPCQAMFSDGQWYPATVQSAAPNGQYRVLFDHYAVPLALPPQSLLPSSRSAAEGYVGVPAPKRLKLDEASVPARPPRKIVIKEDDDEKTKEHKRRLNKQLKSKQRLLEKEQDQQQRAKSWQSFRANKTGKQKAGFLTKVSDQSMFAVPEGGRVGFTSSGKAPAPVVEKRKHEFHGQAATDDHE